MKEIDAIFAVTDALGIFSLLIAMLLLFAL